MKRLIICVLAFFLVLGLTPAVGAGPVEEVTEAVRQFIKAYDDGNADALASFYAEDAVFIRPASPFRVEGREAIRALWTGFFQRFTASLAFRQPEYRAYGDNVVASTAYYTFIAIDKSTGTPTTTHGRVAITGVKLDGKWLIVNHHGSTVPASP